ncbi:unnamed protein product [Cylicocyclus nassatus]|uniref:Uncharacterized protein n=1 Tax=Cylicocyclus nassatus TaxID=53992 RepID=A0AA36M651_CYLNA|nr:unnamed protein product [Cylicocyclus nassatus]
MTPAQANKDEDSDFDLPPLWIDLEVPESDIDSSNSDYELDDGRYSDHESSSFEEPLVCEPVAEGGSDSPTPNEVAYAIRQRRRPSPPWPEVTPFDFSVDGFSEWEREEASRYTLIDVFGVFEQ